MPRGFKSVVAVILIYFIFCIPVKGQSEYTLSGRVIDAESGAPIPFANIYIEGTQTGTTTDFEGFYSFRTRTLGDSIVASYIGYAKRAKPLVQNPEQIINFQLLEEVTSLQEVVFYAGENPAFEIMRNIVDNKKKNDKRQLDAYEYESYTKIEVDVDNITDKFKRSALMRRVSQVVDSVEIIAGEDGKAILPIFISEAISRFYFKKDPYFRYENVLKTRLSGIGITDGTLTSQVIGSSFQEYNFYQNWLNIVEKEFISPLADSWRANYEVDLIDSLYIGDFYCYRLDFFPKRMQDLAFSGTMWIDKNSYALKQIDVRVGKKANLNWIETLKIQQELEPTEAGPWIPVKTRVVVDIGQMSGDMASMIAKFYVSNKDVVINQPYKDVFYRVPITMDENVRMHSDAYWNEHRHDSLTSTEMNVYRMIDTLKTIPLVKTATDLSKVAGTGYHTIGKFDLGPYLIAYSQNSVEGTRLGFGMRTSYSFSDKWVLQGMTGYGFGDERWKYLGRIKFIANRNPWTEFRLESRKEIDQFWLITNDLDNSSLFYAFTRFGNLTDPFLTYTNRLWFSTQVGTGLTQRLWIKTGDYNPLFSFEYYEDPDATDLVTKSDFNITEVGFETRYARDEVYVVNDNNRINLGPLRWPSFTLRYTVGLKNRFYGDFDYHKVEMKAEKNQKMGNFGRSNIALSGGYIFGQLPYPLLKNHIGNESPFFLNFTYNLMRFAEFTSDRYVAFRYHHWFEGLILNRFPLLRKLKLRTVAHVNLLWGSLQQKNLETIPAQISPTGELEYGFAWLDPSTPYVEVGYGIENILRFGRVDFLHRLTYLGDPDVKHFGIKFSLQFIL